MTFQENIFCCFFSTRDIPEIVPRHFCIWQDLKEAQDKTNCMAADEGNLNLKMNYRKMESVLRKQITCVTSWEEE